MIFKKLVLFLMFLVLTGCGEVTTGGGTQTETVTVTLSGTVTYDSIPYKSTTSAGLDYNNIVKRNVRGAKVTVENSSGTTLGTTTTDENGFYSLSVTGTSVRVRVFAQMYKAASSNQSSWDFQVKDNTNSAKPIYVINGTYANLGENSSQTRNLHASSGWGGSSYTSTRAAAPFSILDVVYQSVQKVLTADENIVFPALDIFWSTENREATISTSHYSSSEVALYILGKENADTDEYDSAVLAHEWGHYYEDKFSRSDSIGGSHSHGDMLDIRVAFGEGFATAWGGLITGTQYYQDSGGDGQQKTLVSVDLDDGGSTQNEGWFSEASIYHMIYDIYDTNDDTGDTLSLPFASLHNLLIDAQKNTAAFTSIFSYITALKAQNPTKLTEIDAITNNEGIAPISDIYGANRTNRAVNANPLYTDVSVGASATLFPNYSVASQRNKYVLGEYNFVKFTVPTERSYTVTVNGTVGTNLSFLVFKEGSKSISLASSSGNSISDSGTLSVGDYRMYISDSNRLNASTVTVTLN